MALRHAVAPLVLLLLQSSAELRLQPPDGTTDIPAFLQEPDYTMQQEAGRWKLKKPALRIIERPETQPHQEWILFESPNWSAVNARKQALPRLRLSRKIVRFNPLTRDRTLVEDWSREPDAREVEADIRALLSRHAEAKARDLLVSTPIFMAGLNGASGHTAEEPDDPRSFVVYVDPFAATGRLHAAATLAHEFSHVERYRTRRFHANRAAAVLAKPDFILLAAVDELAAYQAEAALVSRFLEGVPEEANRAARAAMLQPDLRWPVALTMLLGFEGPPDSAAQVEEVRRQVLLEIQHRASRYWDTYHNGRLDPALAQTIRNWHSQSAEWREIAQQRRGWLEAGAQGE